MLSRSILRVGLSALVLGLVSTAAACSNETSVARDDDDLTSVTARSRTLEFVGTVYVEPDASDEEIRYAARKQAQTAFGALRTTDMAVNSRELREIDMSTFVKRNVKVVGGETPREMLEVKYTYKDDAVVAASYARRSSVPLALMNPSYVTQLERVLTECTKNDAHTREYRSTAWYVFEPSLQTCQEAIRFEQETITADRAKLRDPRSEVPQSEAERLYVPITAKLGADKTNRGDSFPDYHRLYKGGVKADKLVVSLIYGRLDHDTSGGPNSDYNWGELMTTLSQTIAAQGGGFELLPTPGGADLSHFELASGRKIDNPSVEDLVKLKSRSATSLGLTFEETVELDKLFAERIDKKWFTIEKPIKVAVGNEAPRDFALQFLVYYGASGSNTAPYKFATRSSDVFLYNGHSSIGYGPLDPRNFAAADFPSTYQLLWIDGCVSYNYYHKDYVPLKEGGTANLDLITNGVEAPSWRSGHAMGQFLSKFLDGTGASYKDLLLAAADTEALRVVDGELDNVFKPTNAATRVAITNR